MSAPYGKRTGLSALNSNSSKVPPPVNNLKVIYFSFETPKWCDGLYKKGVSVFCFQCIIQSLCNSKVNVALHPTDLKSFAFKQKVEAKMIAVGLYYCVSHFNLQRKQCMSLQDIFEHDLKSNLIDLSKESKLYLQLKSAIFFF